MPPSLKALGDIAPMPLIVAVAFLILRASAHDPDPSHAEAVRNAGGVSHRAALALLGAHLASYGAFLAACFALRPLGGQAQLGLSLGWAALGALSLALLAAFAFARAGFRDVARRAAGPLGVGALVGVAAWGAGRGTGELWHPLARFTLHPVGVLVEIFSDDVVADVDRFIVGTERFFIRVDPVCSGYEGMGLTAVLLGAYLWTFKHTLRFPHALLLPVLAMAGAFVANVVRITALIYVGALGSPEVAIGGFHSKAGWLLFCAVALGTTYVARRARFFQRPAADDGSSPHDAPHVNPTAAYLLPLLALVTGSLAAGLASDGSLDHLELVSLAAACAALVYARHTVREAMAPVELGAPAPGARGGAWLGVAAGVVVFVLWMGLDTTSAADSARRAAEVEGALGAWSSPRAALWIGTRLVASVLLVPLVEELAFRGFLLRRIVAADFTAVRFPDATALAIVVSSVAFGALHDRWLAGTIAGLAYAAVVWRTGRLRDAVLAHVVTNALIAVVVLAWGRWALWD